MTDDRTLADLDDRGRAAASGVRTAVADRPVPAFDPDLVRIDVDGRLARDRRTRPVVGVLAAAAAVLVVVAAGLALATSGDDDSAPADRVGTEGMGRFVLADPPEGHVLAGVFDASDGRGDMEGEVTPFGPLVVYGPDVETPTVGVYVWPDFDEEEVLVAEDIPAADVGGRRAWRPEGDLAALGAAVAVVVGDDLVGVIGASADPDLLLAVAGAVEVEGDRAVVPPGVVPEGWDHLGDGHLYDLLPGFGGLFTLDGGPVTWLVAYGSGEEGHVMVSVSGGDAVRAGVPALSASNVEEVEVRGHTAVLTRTPSDVDAPDTVAVTWEERPGQVVQVASTTDLAEDAVVRLARDLVAVEADDITRLRREVFEAELADPALTVVGRGTFTGGIEWALVNHGDASEWQLDLVTTAPQGSSSASSGAAAGGAGEGGAGAPRPLEEYAVGEDGSLRYGFGPIPPEVAVVEVRDGSGAAISEAEVVEGAGVRAWVVELPSGDGASVDLTVVAFAADGTEIGSLDISPEG